MGKGPRKSSNYIINQDEQQIAPGRRMRELLTKREAKIQIFFFEVWLHTSVVVSGIAVFKKALKLEKGKI